MPDGVRMMDLASLSRGLEEFKRLDPEQKVLANRLATQAAVHRVEEVHRDVTGAEQAEEARIRDRDHREGGRRGSPDDRRDPPREPPEPEEPPPEVAEGHVLDLKA